MTTHPRLPAAADGQPLAVHLRETLSLAWPIIVSRAGLILLFTVDTMVVGRLGGLDLAGLALGVSPLLTAMLICLGALQSTVTLTAQALGRGETGAVGDILRAALVNGLLLGLAAGMLAFGAESFFVATGQDPAVAAVAAAVALQFAWGMPGQLLFIATNLVLESLGRPRAGMAVMVGANLLNLSIDAVLVLGVFGLVDPVGGAPLVMATSSLVRWLTFLVALAWLSAVARRAGDPWRILATPRDWLRAAITVGGAPGRAMRRMGLPMGLGQGVEGAAFSCMFLFAGLMGTAALAAHQTTMTVMSLVFMISVGVGGATAIRVGTAYGRRAPMDLRRAGWTGIGLGGAVSLACGIGITLFPEAVARVVTDDEAAIAVATGNLRLIGLFVAIDSMMGVTTGALRGIGDVWWPMWIQSGAFWLGSVPAAWLMAFTLGIGPAGLFIGIAVGICLSLALLAPRFDAVARSAGRRWRRAAAGG